MHIGSSATNLINQIFASQVTDGQTVKFLLPPGVYSKNSLISLKTHNGMLCHNQRLLLTRAEFVSYMRELKVTYDGVQMNLEDPRYL